MGAASRLHAGLQLDGREWWCQLPLGSRSVRLQEGRWAEVVVGGGKLASPPDVPCSISAEPLRPCGAPQPALLTPPRLLPA